MDYDEEKTIGHDVVSLITEENDDDERFFVREVAKLLSSILGAAWDLLETRLECIFHSRHSDIDMVNAESNG